jgi:DNA-binding PucR family transcriptional regulator
MVILYRYVIIESKQHKPIDDDVISLFSELISPSSIKNNSDHTIMFFEHDIDLAFEDVILNVMSDTLTDLRVYASHAVSSVQERDIYVQAIQQYMDQIPFEKYYFLDDKIIIKHFIYRLSEDMKSLFLNKFYKDQVMIETLKVYLESNLNMVNAAKKLYIHRNTLIQRLDKFYQVTGLDARLFSEALLVYHLIH